MRPIIISNILHSARILADRSEKFRLYSVQGTTLNEKRIKRRVEGSVMPVTALSPVIGYHEAAHIAEAAYAQDTTLRDAALSSGHVDGATYDRSVDPRTLVGHCVRGA